MRQVIHFLLASAVVFRSNADLQSWNTGNHNRGGYNYGANRTSSCGRRLFESVTVTVYKNGRLQSLLGCRYEANSVEQSCPDPYDGLDDFLEHIYEGVQPYLRVQGRPITSSGSCRAQSRGGYTPTTIPITAYITLIRSKNKGSRDADPSFQGYDYRPKRGRNNWDLAFVNVLVNGVPMSSLLYSNAPSYLYSNAPQRFTKALDALIDFEEKFPPEREYPMGGSLPPGVLASTFPGSDSPDVMRETRVIIISGRDERDPYNTQGPVSGSPPLASMAALNIPSTSYNPPNYNHSNTFSLYGPPQNTNGPPITSYGPPNPSKTNSFYSYGPPVNSKVPPSKTASWHGAQQPRPTNQWQNYS